MNASRSPTDKKQANAERVYIVTRADLPLSCPTPEMALWNSHPRVYLPIEETGTALCPYCSAEFRLEDVEPASSSSAGQ